MTLHVRIYKFYFYLKKKTHVYHMKQEYFKKYTFNITKHIKHVLTFISRIILVQKYFNLTYHNTFINTFLKSIIFNFIGVCHYIQQLYYKKQYV
jgi:hypothetical protein